MPLAPLLDCGDLLGKVRDPRAALPTLGGVALVEALKIVIELGVSGVDELDQRRPREIGVSLLLTALIRVPSTASNSRPKQIQLTTEQHKLAEDLAESIAIVAPKVGDGLEVRLQVPQQPDHLDIAVGFGLQPAA